MICHVAEPHEMPVDEAGNRADIVMDPNSTVSRMNLGRLYELYFNASARDLTKEIIFTLGITDTQNTYAHIQQLENNQDPAFIQAWNRLLNFYAIVSPQTYNWFTSNQYSKSKTHHLNEVVKDGIYIYHPADTPHSVSRAVKELEKYYKPVYGPVTYTGYSGKKVTTKSNVRIGSLYILLLEKTGDDWAAVSSGKLQNFGVLSQITNQDKYSQPTRNQAVRALGETEVRIVASCMGPLIAAEIIDRNNNTTTHRQVVDSVITADNPSNIECAVNRTINPLGNARPLQFVKHIAMCGGWEFKYKPFVAPAGPPYVYEQLKEIVKG